MLPNRVYTVTVDFEYLISSRSASSSLLVQRYYAQPKCLSSTISLATSESMPGSSPFLDTFNLCLSMPPSVLYGTPQDARMLDSNGNLLSRTWSTRWAIFNFDELMAYTPNFFLALVRGEILFLRSGSALSVERSLAALKHLTIRAI